MAALLALARPAFADKPPAGTREAKALFEQGLALSDDAKWADALVAFEKSNALVPSLTVRYNIATTLRVLGRYTESKHTLERILAEGASFKPPLKPALRKDCERLLAEVSQRVVSVFVRVTPPEAEIQVDGAALRLPPTGYVDFDPGRHVFALTAPGHDPTTLTLTLGPSDKEISLVAPKTIPKVVTPLYARAWFLVTLGVAVASAATVGIVVATRPRATPPLAPPESTSNLVLPAALRF